MSFTELELKDICLDMHQGINTVADKVEYRSKGIPIIQSKNITSGYLDLDDVRYLDIDDYEKYKDKYNPNKGDILLCNIGTIGTSLVLKQDSKFLIAWNLFKLKIDTERFNPKYIKYYLDKLKLINYFDRLLTGGTVKFINKTKMGQIRIPICDIRKQDKIVSVLDKAQELIDKRKEQIEALDELVKSQFIEMFGDPVLNPKGWEKGKIADIIVKTQYGTSNKANEENGQFKILRMGNITYNGQFDFNDMKYIDLTEDEQKKYLVYKGEVLFNRTNSKELVGKTAVYKENEPMAYAGYLVKAIPNERATGEFIAAYMNTKYVKSKLLNMAKNIVGMANINAEEFKKIDIYIPTIELQNEYIKLIEQVDKLKFEMEKSLKELEDNFNSLIQKAFNGELFN